MAKNRDKQKENKRLRAYEAWKAKEEKEIVMQEERLNSKTEWGISDPVPQEAVNNIIHQLLAS